MALTRRGARQGRDPGKVPGPGVPRRRRVLLVGAALVPAALVLLPAAWLVFHVYFDRTGMPDLEAFLRVDEVIRTARQLGIRTPLQPFLSTALGASEVRLLELTDAYRAMASGVTGEPHVVDRVTDVSSTVLYSAPKTGREINSSALRSIQEGLRGVVRLPGGTAHTLDARDFPVPVMGKTGTTSDFRDALFVGSTYGMSGITVAVRIGFDDNRPLGERETGGRAALPIFREIMLEVYKDRLVGETPRFPRRIEDGIDAYLALRALPEAIRVERQGEFTSADVQADAQATP